MELLQERIKDPGPPPQQPLGPKNGVPNGHGEEVPQVPRGEKGRNSRENENPMKNNPKYFNTNFAQFDAICGGEQQQSKYERVPMSQCQQSNYQRPGKTRESQAQTQGTGVNTVRMENGTLNIHIPCAYTYPYMPRPLPPPNECPIEETSKPVKKKPKNPRQSADGQMPQNLGPRSRSTSKAGRDSYEPCPTGPPPFCSTVNTVRGPPNKGFFLPCPPPDCGGPPQGRVKTCIKWDYAAGVKIPFKKVEYGEELYELAAQNMAKQMELEKIVRASRTRSSTSAATSSATLESLIGEDKCRDFSRPAFHSSLKATGDLVKALDQLNRLPAQMEKIFMNDERFDPILLDKATKVLNVPREEKVFKDLIPVEPNTEAKERVTKSISEQIKAVRPASRSKDPEPNLLDYQEASFSRIKPSSITPPPKPQAGVSVDITNQTKYQIIDAEKQFEEDADKI